ncbi:MAG: shikimate kinase [Clostridia bacterium]|nr:shikimate kinase [Clostridia bacterium]MBQ7306152.1 shikimate kinase [Clostridia bacterium]
MLERHVFLIGMPGCGKSSLGKRVAGNMRIPYVDMDQRISDIVGCTVSEMFERYGEQAFRNAETNTLIQLTRETPSLISTGGGTVLRENNRAIMRNSGVIVLIDRPLEEILGDIKLDRRPLLAQKGLGEVERLYHERIDIYRSVADFVMDNSNGYHAGLRGLEQIMRHMGC